MTNRKTADLGRLAGCVTLSSNVKEDVAVASSKLNSICPGAAS